MRFWRSQRWISSASGVVRVAGLSPVPSSYSTVTNTGYLLPARAVRLRMVTDVESSP